MTQDKKALSPMPIFAAVAKFKRAIETWEDAHDWEPLCTPKEFDAVLLSEARKLVARLEAKIPSPKVS